VGTLEVPGGNRLGFAGQGRAAKEEMPHPYQGVAGYSSERRSQTADD